MSMIRRGDKNYFIGLNWLQLYMPKKLQSEIDAMIVANNLRSPLGVVRHAPKGSTTQNQVGFTEDADAKGCYSGASVLANALEQGLLVEEVAEGLYWIVLILDHAVVAGTDRIFKVDVVEERVREFLGYAGSDDIAVYMSGASAGNLPMFEHYEPLDFLGIIEAAASDPHKRDVRITPLKKLPVGKIMGAILIAGGLGAGYWYLNGGSQVSADLAAGIPAFAPKEEIVVPTLTEELRTKARLEEASWLFQQSLLSPEYVLSALQQRFDRLPLSVSGWSLVSMKFDAATPDSALLTYRREPLGTPYALTNALPLEWSFSETAEMAEATVFLAAPLGEAPADIMAEVNDNDTRWIDFVDAVQSRGLNVSVVEALSSDRPTPISGLPDTVPEAFKRQLKVQQRNFSATGGDWLSADAFGRAVQPLNYIAVKTVEIALDSSALNWTMSGEVYEHAE